jgi:F1F0 ATPase subunit 2
MNEAPALVLALLAGVMIGTVFFGALWWTIRRGILSKRPAVWFFGSLVVRTVIAVFGFYVVSHGEGRRLLACLLGFLLARVLMTRLAREPVNRGNRIIGGGRQ